MDEDKDFEDKDFEQVLKEFDQAAEAVYQHPECPEVIAKLTLEFLVNLHGTMAKHHMHYVDHLRANAVAKFGNEAAVILDKQ